MDCFCLTPLNPDDQRWVGLGITPRRVWTLARDCTHARDIVAHTMDVFPPSPSPPSPSRQKIDYQLKLSPWKLADVTSCQLDNSRHPPLNNILFDNGETRPCNYSNL